MKLRAVALLSVAVCPQGAVAAAVTPSDLAAARRVVHIYLSAYVKREPKALCDTLTLHLRRQRGLKTLRDCERSMPRYFRALRVTAPCHAREVVRNPFGHGIRALGFCRSEDHPARRIGGEMDLIREHHRWRIDVDLLSP
ncbi:MAG: hypothetical protein JWM71_1501 [Solirubrobacteraceae bacterium]|nr:hypothetical protein [Solirubrobacteraceae bacterium]